MTSSLNEVERVYSELEEQIKILDDGEHLSDLSNAQHYASKTILLSAASYFERRILDIILVYCRDKSSTSLIPSFIEKQALARKYHSMFDWDSRNANRFFALFGVDFKKHVEDLMDSDTKAGVKAFMRVGSLRNQLVHGNYATFSLEQNAKEIYSDFVKAKKFVDQIPDFLAGFAEKET